MYPNRINIGSTFPAPEHPDSTRGLYEGVLLMGWWLS